MTEPAVEERGTETDEAIRLSAVTKRFGQVIAVNDLDLSVLKGEFLTLLGPSGCGKTTTLRIIGGFEYPDSGEVLIDGEPMGRRPPFRRPVNTVFQHYALFPHLNVWDNIAYGLRSARRPRPEVAAAVREVLALVRLDGVERRKPRELSGGQQQRVALARALVMQPKVLLLDEPLGSLDYKLRKEMQIELKAIHRTVGTTFVYVTHDQEEAMAMSDRICVMQAGRVLQRGTPAEIYDAPANLAVASFMGNMNFVRGRVTECTGSFARVRVDDLGVVIADGIHESLQPGQAVIVGVRPEDAQVSMAGSDRGNVFAGRCIEQLVVGPSAVAVVEHGSWLLNVQIPKTQATDLRGNDVWTVWPPDRVHVFREEAT